MNEKEKEFLSLSQGYKIRDQRGLYYVTFQVVYWIDIFSRQVYRDIIIDSLRYCIKNKGLNVHAFVIMTNHVHAILSSEGDELSDIIRDLSCKSRYQFLARTKAQLHPSESSKGRISL